MQLDSEFAIRCKEHLRSVSLFEQLKDHTEALDAFLSRMSDKTFAKGAHIFEEGGPGKELFILLSGTVSVVKMTQDGDKFRVALLNGEQHAFFGEGGLVGTDQRSATLVAESECHCLVLERDHLNELGSQRPDWVLPFYKKIAGIVLQRFRKTNADLMVLYKALVEEARGHSD